MAATVDVGGVLLLLSDDPARIDARDDDLAGLALLLDAALAGDVEDLGTALDRREAIRVPGCLTARPVTIDDEQPEARARWRARGGADADDAYLVAGPAAPHAIVVPRDALQRAWAAVREHAAPLPDLTGVEELEAAARARDARPAVPPAERRQLGAALTRRAPVFERGAVTEQIDYIATVPTARLRRSLSRRSARSRSTVSILAKPKLRSPPKHPHRPAYPRGCRVFMFEYEGDP